MELVDIARSLVRLPVLLYLVYRKNPFNVFTIEDVERGAELLGPIINFLDTVFPTHSLLLSYSILSNNCPVYYGLEEYGDESRLSQERN